jgi:flavin-dependent dehydrogenase
MLPDNVDVVIIGAGPSGVAAASILHKEGLNPLVVERDTFPRFVIGESLLPRCMDLLEETGLIEACKSRDYLVKTGAEFLRGDERCTFVFSAQHTNSWDYTWQVPRDDFDKTLADTLEEMGVPIHYRTEVVDATFDPTPVVTVKTPEGAEHKINCKFVIDASGYGRVLPRLLDLNTPSHLPERHSLFTWIDNDDREPGDAAGRTWVAMHPGGAWIWVIPFANGKTSVGIVAEPEFFDSWPTDPTERFTAIIASEPNVAKRLANANVLFSPVLMEGYSIGIKQLFGPGWCLVGNTTEFLDPVFSSGITLALESSVAAAKVCAKEIKGEEADWQKDYADYLMGGVDCFRTYVDAWYTGDLPTVFFTPNPPKVVQEQVCSVLAGHAWDPSNPFVTRHASKLPQLVKLVTGTM